jgi:hypothetical protein
MPIEKLHITDERMLQLMDHCIRNKVNDVGTQRDWCELVGITPTNIFNIRKGMQQVTKQQIYQACKVFNVSADYIYGFTDKMIRVQSNISPIDRIKEAVRELETVKKKVSRKAVG